jgi:alpha-beta hydrolase superfamily lysophospholipase
VWSQFRSLFESRGVKVYTPTLRPELRVGMRARPPRALRELTLADYVSDLEQEVDHIERETGMKPAVIGHSMGGLLAAALAARGRVSAGVFISPAAPAGVQTLRHRLFWSGFSLAHRMGWTPPVVRPTQRTLDRMVIHMLPVAERAAVLEAMVHESGRAFADFANFPIDEAAVRVPVLVVAAGRDRLVPASLVRLTGRKFAAAGGEFREYANHGHWLYSEPGWETPANEIFDWLAAATKRSELAPQVATAHGAHTAHDSHAADNARDAQSIAGE